MSNRLGETFFSSPSQSFRDSAAEFSLRASDFETKIRIPDKSSSAAGMFILPVETQTAYGSDGKTLDTFVLQGAVAVNQATAEKLTMIGFTKYPTLLMATNVAKIHNNEVYGAARKLLGIASMKREEIDLSTLLVQHALKAEAALTH